LFHQDGRFAVQSLDRDPGKVAAARAAIDAEGRYGPVSARLLAGRTLPYSDNLVNIVVVHDPLGIKRPEMLRVLRPLGVLWVRDGDGWKRHVKPWPEALDEWTHFLHDATGNPVSHDREVGPPRRLQWTAGPPWGRSHEMNSSMPAMVSAKGRLFYVFDFGQTGIEDERLPEKWTLLARDAFNGSLLWERPMPSWGSKAWGNKALRFFGGTMARRLVADGDRLYCTPEFGKEVEVLDAATGKTLATLPGTEGAEEILVDGDHLVSIARNNKIGGKARGILTCVDLSINRISWQVDDTAVKPQLTTIGRDAVVYDSGKDVVCLNRKDGSVRWTFDPKPPTKKAAAGGRSKDSMLVLSGEHVVVNASNAIHAISLETGKSVWTFPGPQGNTMRGYDLFVVDGTVWCSGQNGSIVGYDLRSGTQADKRDVSGVQSAGHHLRCYRAKATDGYLITQYRGVEFLSLTEAPHNQNDWMRGSCTYGVMPANGFLYQPPHSCFCFAGAMMKGLNAFGAGPGIAAKVQQPGPLEKGPAFGKTGGGGQTGLAAWPVYRGDVSRSGAIAETVKPDLKRSWKTALGTGLTPPVAADGRVFVAAKDRHTVHALDAVAGRELWSFIAGARIDSPPSLHAGAVVFGCADGRLYCLRARDGALAWARRLAPEDRWLSVDGQLESVWRLHGSVAIVNDLAYCSAGRSSFLDGGLFLYAVDIATGEIRHQLCVDTRSDTRTDAVKDEFVAAYHIEGGNSDLMVAEGGYLYIHQMKFTPDLKPVPASYPDKEEITSTPSLNLDNKAYVNEDIYKVRWKSTTYDTYDKLATIIVNENKNVGARHTGLHMMTTSGFLDDSYFSRTFWMYAQTWPGFNMSILAPKSGQLVVAGPDKTYALKGFTSRFPLSPKLIPQTKGYLLIADDNGNEPTMDPRAWGRDKGMGFGRGAPPVWHHWIPVRGLAMTLAGKTLFVCGPADVVKEGDPMASFEGRLGSELWALSARDGSILAKHHLEEMPVFDGMIAAEGRIFLTSATGEVIAMEAE
jgi:outer membrane protein assembly factor BamB